MVDISHKSKYKRYFEYPITGFLANSVYRLFKCLPVRINSGIGSWIFSFIGPRRKEHLIAKENIKKSFPNLNDKEVDDILSKMWKNLGRTFFEYLNLGYLMSEKGGEFIKINQPKLVEKIKKDGKPVIFFSAHFGNWEALSYLFVTVLNMPCAFIYRPPNNPYLKTIFSERETSLKEKAPDFPATEKGIEGFRKLISYIKKGFSLLTLIDQKFEEGIDIDFLGRKVKAVPSTAKLALRFKRDVYMAIIRRVGKNNFEIDLTPVAYPELSGDEEKDVKNFTQIMNDHIGEVIKKNPEQWMWVHDRFKY